MNGARLFIVKVAALAYCWTAASSFDAINDARDQFGLGVAISAMASMSKLRAAALAVLCIGMIMVFGVGVTTLIERAFLTDTPGPDSVFVHTDSRTGCQYLVGLHTGMFPRLGTDGKPMCKEVRP